MVSVLDNTRPDQIYFFQNLSQKNAFARGKSENLLKIPAFNAKTVEHNKVRANW